MAKPRWLGPFAPIPENWEELRQAVWTTGILTGAYTAIWAAHVWNTIPRMASHYYWNPSRRAIIGHAIRQTPMPSLTRSVTGLGWWTPVAIIVLGMTAAEYFRGQRVDFEGSYAQMRIQNARAMAMGEGWQFTGTHDMFHFGDSPHTGTQYGEQWYSFHPEWI